jgi:hypothetical protein
MFLSRRLSASGSAARELNLLGSGGKCASG